MARIADLQARADPAIALAAIRAAQADPGRRVDQRGGAPPTREAAVIVELAASVSEASKTGERRAIHRRPSRRVKPVPKRPSMLDPHRVEIEAWLDARPEMPAVEALARLKERHPDRFADLHLRTTQRLVKAWRADQAARMIRLGAAGLTPSLAKRRSPWRDLRPWHSVAPQDAATGWPCQLHRRQNGGRRDRQRPGCRGRPARPRGQRPLAGGQDVPVGRDGRARRSSTRGGGAGRRVPRLPRLQRRHSCSEPDPRANSRPSIVASARSRPALLRAPSRRPPAWGRSRGGRGSPPGARGGGPCRRSRGSGRPRHRP